MGSACSYLLNEDAAYELLLRAFGFWDLPVQWNLYVPFSNRVAAWEHQDELDRTLFLLFEELDHTASAALKPAGVDRMRAVVRNAFA